MPQNYQTDMSEEMLPSLSLCVLDDGGSNDEEDCCTSPTLDISERMMPCITVVR